jgi:ATP-grasp domain
MTGTVQLIISNSAEYFLRDPDLNLTGDERARVVRFSGTYECEHCVFWTDAPRVLVLPPGVDTRWFADVHDTLGIAAPPYVTPAASTGLLVGDLLADGTAQQQLRELVAGYTAVSIQVVGPTPEVYLLSAIVRGWGHDVELDCVPAEDYWVSLYLDSKVSVLDLARQNADVPAAAGVIVSNWIELRGAVTTLLGRYGTVIARTAYGVAGDGAGVIRDAPGAVDEFLERASRDSFFAFPILVQEFIDHAPGVGCPAVDILVGKDGVDDLVLCALTVENGYQFRSVDVGDGALPPAWAERATTVAQAVGAAAHALGYRGWMCADCVAGADDRLYVTEINARRSGSLHAGGLLRFWGAERELTLSAPFMMPVPAGVSYAEDIRPVFERLWARGVRAFPTSVRGIAWDEPMIAVIAAASTAAEAHDIVAGIQNDLNPIALAHPA